MGTYLSTPASEKYKEWGEEPDCPVQPLRFALVDMQGWRKSMEDAHVVETTVPYPPGGLSYLSSAKEKENIPKAKVFGVFDGHGGPEVARFCQLYLVSVLTQNKPWSDDDEDGSSETATPEDAEKTDIGQALIKSFHALDRMIDDPARRDEIIRLRTNKAPPTERREAEGIPLEQPVVPLENGGSIVKATDLVEGTNVGSTATNLLPPPSPPPAPTILPLDIAAAEAAVREAAVREASQKNAATAVDTTKDESKPATEEQATLDLTGSSSDSSTEECTASEDSGAPENNSNSNNNTTPPTPPKEEEEETEDAKSDSTSSGSDKDYDSDEAVGKEEAAKRDQDLEDTEDDSHDVQINPYDGAVQVVEGNNNDDTTIEADPTMPSNKVTTMFQRLLNMNDQSGQMVVQVAGEDNAAEGTNPTEQVQPVHTGPSASLPSILQNGRLICNLPDHPIHAGCTAVVAVMLGMTITIANAGDSRGVLCREGGVTEPLSFDHKPSQPREMNRINNAGGFVNRFGRVNGNLNLSRSIGDLKYKQVPGIAPSDQMITAQPDIIQVTLNPKDEFFVLGCDGIWDCLTNEKCVEFVRERIDTMEPKAIGEEMLNTILSDDPRATQGIGGDNMTILIVDLQPASRSYTVDPPWGPDATSAL